MLSLRTASPTNVPGHTASMTWRLVTSCPRCSSSNRRTANALGLREIARGPCHRHSLVVSRRKGPNETSLPCSITETLPQSDGSFMTAPGSGRYSRLRWESRRKDMKGAVITRYKESLEVQDLPDPWPGPGDAIVRTEACGICRSDWHLWQHHWTWLGL